MVTEVERRMIRDLDHIHACPAGDMALDAMAGVAALSRFHFHRVFHAVTGETAAQAVRRVRLYRGSLDLLGGAAPVAAIAQLVGHPELPCFARALAAACGVPPVQPIVLPAAHDMLYRQWLPGSGNLSAHAPMFKVIPDAPTTTTPDHLITDPCLPKVPT